MSVSSHRLDRLATTFDHGGSVANAGLVLAATLMTRLGLPGLIRRWVNTGCPNPDRKVLPGSGLGTLVTGSHPSVCAHPNRRTPTTPNPQPQPRLPTPKPTMKPRPAQVHHLHMS